jgi:hypothetical protein
MLQSMTTEQQEALRRDLAMVQALLAIPGVKKHETRFEGEIALVSPIGRFVEVSAVVEGVMGTPAKSAREGLPAKLAAGSALNPMGDIRGDQTLYLKSMDGDLSLYVAYWPRGGGDQFTIKLGVLVGVPAFP